MTITINEFYMITDSVYDAFRYLFSMLDACVFIDTPRVSLFTLIVGMMLAEEIYEFIGDLAWESE